ncbi:MAG TPA: pyridoxal phosphate-dependent aminotransferase [Vicinamibacterales bacterium]
MFSSRVPGELEPNRLTMALRRARAANRALLDLTVTNPTTVGFDYPSSMLAGLGAPEAMRYAPRAFGMASARAAVAADYRRRGISVAPDDVVLTASTSEAYTLLFKLLCEPAGDAVLVPVPSYPLFDHLTRLDGIRALPYRLAYHGRWVVEIDTVDAAWTPSVRAVLGVSPNNPTGSILAADELAALESRCAERDAALILDEVFADYTLIDGVLGDAPASCLRFRLGGLSKSAGLPQVKLGWIAVDGPRRLVDAALERLELICDTYLSVSTPVQVAAPALIESGATVRRAIVERIRRNYATLGELTARHPAVERLHADGGWSAVVRVPSTRSEEDLVIELLERDGVVVHPGFFFDFAHEAYLVVSLLPEPAAFREGVSRMLERADA